MLTDGAFLFRYIHSTYLFTVVEYLLTRTTMKTKITYTWNKKVGNIKMADIAYNCCDTKENVDDALELLFKMLLSQFNLDNVPKPGTTEFGDCMLDHADELFDFQDTMKKNGMVVEIDEINGDTRYVSNYNFINECTKLIDEHGDNILTHQWLGCKARREKRINKAKRASANASDDEAPTKKQKV